MSCGEDGGEAQDGPAAGGAPGAVGEDPADQVGDLIVGGLPAHDPVPADGYGRGEGGSLFELKRRIFNEAGHLNIRKKLLLIRRSIHFRIRLFKVQNFFTFE